MTRGGVSMNHVYDEVGNRTQRTDYNGVVTNYTYDNLNRLTIIAYPTRTVTYLYDPLNNLTRATNENGSVYISYDNRYRVNSVSDPFYYGISYNYDTVGNRTNLKVNGATHATYTYDAANRLTNIADSTNLSFVHTYDAANRLTSRSAPNGVTSNYVYDDLNRLTSLMHAAGATTLSGNLYTYDDASNISSWTTQTAQRAYTYDAVDRLTGVSNFELPTESYTYDAVGNRTASHLSPTYGYQAFNKLTSTVSATYTYDNNANVISKTDSQGNWSFSYDEENRLSQVVIPTGRTVSYKYDGLGRRIQRTTTGGSDQRYVYDNADVMLDLNADWSVATTYLSGSGIDSHLRQTNATTGVSYYLTDHLGSTAALSDVNGALLEQHVYDSFGKSAGSTLTRYGYTGRERDPDTDLLYYRARTYDPKVGRFYSEDPIGLRGDSNMFAYTANDPIRFTDPSGTQMRSDRNWNEGEINPLTGETMHNDFRQAAGMACALDGFNPWAHAELGGGFHLLNIIGGNGAVGGKFNFYTGETCLYVRVCGRSGYGIYVGGGANLGLALGPSEGQRSRGLSGQLGADIAVPGEAGKLIGQGSSGTVGFGGLGFGAGPTLGAGFSFGLDLCTTRLVCFNSPNCGCYR